VIYFTYLFRHFLSYLLYYLITFSDIRMSWYLNLRLRIHMTPQFSENNIYGSQSAVFADARSLGNTVSMNNVLHNVIDLNNAK